VIEARIGGDGVTAPYLTATHPADKVSMIDNWLAEHPDDVMYLEVKQDDPRSWRERWDDWDAPREFMRVGVAGEWAAAEYVLGGTEHAAPVIHATFNLTPPPDAPHVPYGYGRFFPVDTVVPLAQVRQLMLDFVLTGEWSHAALWRDHETMVA
jgi:hypothetical protein